jgi:hypothetical protein
MDAARGVTALALFFLIAQPWEVPT